MPVNTAVGFARGYPPRADGKWNLSIAGARLGRLPKVYVVHLDFYFYFFFWHATMLCLISFSLLLRAFVHLFVYLLFVLFFFGFLIWRSRAQ